MSHLVPWDSRSRKAATARTETADPRGTISTAEDQDTAAEETGITVMEENRRIRMKVELKEKERIDDLQRNGYQIIQNPEKFCFGMDAVLLTGFAHARESDKMLDLGTGTGIIPLLMEAKYHCAHLTGLEIQEESADMARRSVSHNGLEERIDIVTGDIKEAASIFGAASFGVITTNPPYMIGDHGLKNQNTALYIARHEALCTLDDILRESAKLLKVKGRFYMVHRPFRLPEIMTKMCAYGIEPKRMRLVYPHIDKEPNMVLIEGMKGGNPRMQVEPPLIVYQKDGSYTEELLEMYGMNKSEHKMEE